VNWTAPIESGSEMVDVNGARLFTRRVGSGPPVVVLHGGPGAHHDYLLPQYDLLARGRTLLYYDQRGGGRSPASRDTPLGWREHVADLEALRTYWGLGALTLLGYSWGGLLALLYTLAHRDRTERLALVCPAPVTVGWRDEFQRHLEARMADPAIQRARADLATGGLRGTDPERYRRLAFALSVAGYFRDPARAHELTPFRVTARAQDAVWTSLGRYDLRDEIRAAFGAERAPPALVVAGVYDPMPLEAARELAALLHARLVELPTGHAPHVEATERFVETLDGFLPKVAIGSFSPT
jgi:proline iminopeptidase